MTNGDRPNFRQHRWPIVLLTRSSTGVTVIFLGSRVGPMKQPATRELSDDLDPLSFGWQRKQPRRLGDGQCISNRGVYAALYTLATNTTGRESPARGRPRPREKNGKIWEERAAANGDVNRLWFKVWREHFDVTDCEANRGFATKITYENRDTFFRLIKIFHDISGSVSIIYLTPMSPICY